MFVLIQTVFLVAAYLRDLFDSDMVLTLLPGLRAFAAFINDRIGSLLLYISDIVDLEDDELIPRGHSCHERVFRSFDDFLNDDDAKQKTNFTVLELQTLLEFFQLNDKTGAYNISESNRKSLYMNLSNSNTDTWTNTQ